jgi:peptidoglycan/LPS O-acetylase OafA/YrhL
LFLPARDAAGLFRTVLPVGWTLNFEMLFYGVFAIGLACRRPPLQTLLILLGPLAVLGFFRAPDWPALLYFANPLVLEFCFGVALAASLPAWPARRMQARAWGALWLLGLALLLLLVPPGHWRFLVWGMPAAMMVAGAVGLEASCGARIPRLVLLLGDASYAIYLVHLFVLPPIALLLRHAGVEGRVALSRLLLGGMVASAAVGVAVDRWVDRPIQERRSTALPA